MATTAAPTANTARSTWNIDPTHTLVEFSARHMMITTVKGTFGGVEGKITVDEAEPARSSAEVTLDAASIDTRVEQRDTHLRSADFLNVEEFPNITFRSRRIDRASLKEGSRFRVIGDLTIRGTTREVELDVTYEGRGRDPWGGERVSFSADARLDRRDFGLVWNQTLETGGILVSNDVKLHFEVQAVKAQ